MGEKSLAIMRAPSIEFGTVLICLLIRFFDTNNKTILSRVWVRLRESNKKAKLNLTQFK